MGFSNFSFCTRHGMFDVRHYMILGAVVMTTMLLTISHSPLQARIVDPGLRLAQQFDPIALDFRLKTFGQAKTEQQAQNLTHLASIKEEGLALQFSPKNRVTCSIEAARAAANGDTSKISPCVAALFSGNMDELVTLPEKMSAFFIETMGSDIPEEKKAAVLINSMFEMMEAMTGGLDTSKKTPEATAATQ